MYCFAITLHTLSMLLSLPGKLKNIGEVVLILAVAR